MSKLYEYDLTIAVTLTVRAESSSDAEHIIRSAPFVVRADSTGRASVTEEASLESWDLVGVVKAEGTAKSRGFTEEEESK